MEKFCVSRCVQYQSLPIAGAHVEIREKPTVDSPFSFFLFFYAVQRRDKERKEERVRKKERKSSVRREKREGTLLSVASRRIANFFFRLTHNIYTNRRLDVKDR